MLRKAKDKLRSVNAERKRHLHLRPGQHSAARSQSNSTPARVSHMKFSAIDDAFEAALNDEGAGSIFSSEGSGQDDWQYDDPPAAGGTERGYASLDTSLTDSTTEQEDELDKKESFPPEESPAEDGGFHRAGLEFEHMHAELQDTGMQKPAGTFPSSAEEESDDDLFSDDKLCATSTEDRLPAGDTPNSSANDQRYSVTTTHTERDLFDTPENATVGGLFPPPPTKRDTTVANVTPLQSAADDISSASDSNWLFKEEDKEPILISDTAGLLEDDATDLFPSIEEVERSLANVRPEDHLSPQETPLSSLPSSYEGDHRFSDRSPRESSPISDHPLDALVTKSPSKAPDLFGGSDKPFEAEATIVLESAPVLIPQAATTKPASSIFTPTSSTEHPLSKALPPQAGTPPSPLEQPQPAASATKDDDLFEILEDYYTSERVSSMSSSGPKSKRTLSDQSQRAVEDSASLGVDPMKTTKKKVPPPRPAMSPQLKQRLSEGSLQRPPRQVAGGGRTSNGVRVKHVKPLGRSSVALVHETAISSTPTDSSQQRSVLRDHLESAARDSEQTSMEGAKSDGLFPDEPTSSEQADVLQAAAEKEAEPLIRAKAKDLLFEEIDEEKAKLTDDSEAPDLSISYHLLLSFVLYVYYSLNVFPYVAGFFAGFLLLFVVVGAAFVYHAHSEEGGGASQRGRGKQALRLSQAFVNRMQVQFDKLKTYEHKRFAATLSYNPTTHHPSQRMRTELLLYNNYQLTVKIHDLAHNFRHRYYLDLKECKVEIVPSEVAQNRKRRWSKKFPILLTRSGGTRRVYLFSPTSRDKEDWFRRLRSASLGVPSESLIQDQREFFAYMQHYFPTDPTHPSFAARPRPQSRRQQKLSTRASSHKPPTSTTRVQFSKSPEVNIEEEEEDNDGDDASSISITRSTSPHLRRNRARPSSSDGSRGEKRSQQQQQQQQQRRASSEGLQSIRSVDSLSVTSRDSVSSLENSYEFVPGVPRPPRDTDWVNALAARLCWDVWHEQRWKDWVMTRIQKKLIRVKTPSFMEQLHLTDVCLGNDMPVINRLISGPKLDLRGIWVYLDVTYSGLFVMTIETKLKFGKKVKENEEELIPLTKTSDESRHASNSSPGSQTPPQKPPRSSSHPHSSHPHTSTKEGEYEIDSGSDDEDTAAAALQQSLEEEVKQLQDREQAFSLNSTSSPSSPNSPLPSPPPTVTSHAPIPASKGRRLKSMMSRITSKVVNTRIVQRAARKVSSYKLVLTVEVRRLDGTVAVNIPPPPADTIWYGFVSSPQLELVAKPRLGHRQVTLSKVTHWIERKLCELVDKKLVLPEMEDLVIPILNSGLPEDKQGPLSSSASS